MKEIALQVANKYGNDASRLMDILTDIQVAEGFIAAEAIEQVAASLGVSQVDVEQTLSFYHFFSKSPTGRYAVYLNDSAVAKMMGRADVAKAFEEAVGCSFGKVSDDGQIGLFDTACIGMADQEPAALINGVVFTQLTPARVKELIHAMKEGKSLAEMTTEGLGDGMNARSEINAMIVNSIRKRGAVVLGEFTPGESIRKMVNSSPEDVIAEIKKSYLRGRGGAGFPTGMKWDFCRRASGDKHFVFCNADEGEPGTFKDRVLLTELPQLVFEGMTVAGYAIGANDGILYLRYEYKYMQNYLEGVLQEMRDQNLLGNGIAGKDGFNFDIRIQFGAGAYVCGEESALIESAEGKRGEPRDRPPFPVEKGYMDQPTAINNVETLCSAAKILIHGADWYKALGTADSAGTKVLSVSGDCAEPGIYEVEWGFHLTDILRMVGADPDAVQAVQVGGPSGTCIGPDDFGRVLCYSDLATGGSMIIFNKSRNILKDVVLNFMEFFIDESCGSCVPCRSLTVLYREKLKKILAGHGVMKDLKDLEEWSPIMAANRCGLGQTAANPILSTLRNFRHLYEDLIQKDIEFDTGFDLSAAVQESCAKAGRKPNLEECHV